MQRVDVAVVGGGPAGLVTAKAIARALPGTTVKVYEASHCHRPQGAGVGVARNGWRALAAIDPQLEQSLRAKAFWTNPESRSMVFNHLGQELPSMGRVGTSIPLFQWSDVRSHLQQALEPGVVQMGTRVEKCSPGAWSQEDASSTHASAAMQPATLRICHTASGVVEEIEAGLVVVADGFFSKTRLQVFGSANTPVFRDKVVWRALLQYDDAGLPAAMPAIVARVAEAGASSFWLERVGEGPGLPRRSSTLYPVGPHRYVWTAVAPVEELTDKGVDVSGLRTHGHMGLERGVQQAGTSGAAQKARALAAFSDFPQPLVELISTIDASTMSEHAYYTHDPEAFIPGCWVHGRVVLLGDAAHTLPPTGQGMNQSFEAAAVLGAALQQHGISQQALSAYESQRLPRLHALLSAMKQGPEGPAAQAVLDLGTFTPLGTDADTHDTQKLSGKGVPEKVEEGAAVVAAE